MVMSWWKLDWVSNISREISAQIIIFHHISPYLPAPSKGWCLNPKGLLSGTPYHPFGTPWRVQVCICVFAMVGYHFIWPNGFNFISPTDRFFSES